MQNACFESFDRKPMSALAETNAKLSAAVQELRASTQAARRCAVDSEKLADAQRDAARSDYMKALKKVRRTPKPYQKVPNPTCEQAIDCQGARTFNRRFPIPGLSIVRCRDERTPPIKALCV